MDVDHLSDKKGSAWLGMLLAAMIIVLDYVLTFGLMFAEQSDDAVFWIVLLSPLLPLALAAVLLRGRDHRRTLAGLAIGILLTLVGIVLLLAWLFSDFNLGA